MQLDHVQLAMPAGAEDQARAFFGDLLRMTEETKPEPLRSRGGCWFRSGMCVVHVGVDPDFHPQSKAHPAFVVNDFDELAARLESSDHPVRRDQSLGGVDRLYTDDPFGNRIEFIRRGHGFSEPRDG
ncbi:MAG: VOC family protein [Phycisphaerales bacterium]